MTTGPVPTRAAGTTTGTTTEPQPADAAGTGWPALLDALEEQHRRWTASVHAPAGEPVDLPPAVPLPRLEQLPPELAVRVEALLEQSRALEHLVAQRQAHHTAAITYLRD